MTERRSGRAPEKLRKQQVEKPRNPRKRYGVIGYPIQQSASPRIHRHWGEKYNKRICYDAIEARKKQFSEKAYDFFLYGGCGLNVTVPHKQIAIRVADTVSERARACGAVNLLEQRKDGVMFADNTDGAGLVHDLKENLRVDLAGSRIAVIGAGGAARGILLPLLEQSPSRLVLASRRPASAKGVTRDLAGGGDIESCNLRDLAGAQFDLIINATSAGLKGRVPSIPTEIILRHAVCYDLAYGKAARPFMKYAERKGAARIIDGWGMLVEQAAESFRIWRGVRPDTAPVLAELPVSA